MNKFKTAIFISLFVVVLDQLTKWIIRSSVHLHENIPLLPFFDITHLRNTGAAFGILKGLPESMRIPLFAIVLVVAIVVISLFLKKIADNDKVLIVSLALILGGAIGNSIDRFRLGYVTDFLSFHWFGNPNYQWPPFNVADSAITIGVILIIFDAFLLKRGR